MEDARDYDELRKALFKLHDRYPDSIGLKSLCNWLKGQTMDFQKQDERITAFLKCKRGVTLANQDFIFICRALFSDHLPVVMEAEFVDKMTDGEEVIHENAPGKTDREVEFVDEMIDGEEVRDEVPRIPSSFSGQQGCGNDLMETDDGQGSRGEDEERDGGWGRSNGSW